MSNTLRVLTLSVLLLFQCIAILAQNGSTRISGKVTDAGTGAPITGASLTVEGSRSGVRSDADGSFFLQVPAGKDYRITVSSVGYQNRIVPGNDSGSTEPVVITLEQAQTQLENVVVMATTRKETLASLYQLQKNSSSISDGISAESIKRSPDRNTGDVLKRVSGTTIQENKFVVIRGLSERYNVSMLNNSVLPSTEADKKAFAFNIIPSSVVDNVIIYKSPTPDLPGDFSGGAVKVLTKEYPSTALSELSFSLGYNSLTTGKDFNRGYANGKTDFIGFFDDSRLVPGPYARHEKGFISQPNNFKKAVTKLFPSTYGYQKASASMPAFSVGYTGGNTTVFKKNGNKLGYIYSLNYSNSRAVSDRNRTDYPIDKTLLYDYNTINYDEKNSLSALLNLTYSYKRSRISLKNLFNNDFVKTTGIRSGTNVVNTFSPFDIRSSNSEATNNGIVNSVLEGLHRINNSWSVTWDASYGNTYRNQPDQRILTLRADNPGSYYLRLSNQNSPEIRNAGRVWSYLSESIYGASADVTKTFRLFDQNQKLKFGTMNTYRDRSVEVTALGYATYSGFGVTIPETKTGNLDNIITPGNIDQYNLTVASIETNSTNYTAHALLNSGYLMLDNAFSDKLKLTWGVRTEKYNQQVEASGKADTKKDNTDILPSALLTYALNRSMNLRLAGSQSVNRPEFRELVDYSVFDYDSYFVLKGNPDLVRSRNSNADLRFEWFPAPGEIISASVFYKSFRDPIEQVNLGNDVLSYANADKAKVYGAEAEIRKTLSFFPGDFFSHLIIYANASYMKGSVDFAGSSTHSPLQGQSPYVLNGGLTYSSRDNGFSVNLLYNRIGPRLRFRAVSEGALNVFERPRDVVDFQVSKKLAKQKLELRFTLSDLFAQPYSWYYKFEANPSQTGYKPKTDKIISTVRWGTSGTLSVRYHF